MFLIQSSLLSIRILSRHFGMSALPGILTDMASRQRKGEPWQDLPLPENEKERMTRKQAAPAILLLDVLSARYPAERAAAVTHEIVRESAVLFLKTVVPVIRKDVVTAMEAPERERFLRKVLDRFPNTVFGKIELHPEGFRYQVTTCYFQVLARRLGRPEVAEMFCSGDALFFERHMPGVRFEQPGTLACGQEVCDFRFSFLE
jgi:hypothetical protein